jgi:hypothetical protein
LTDFASKKGQIAQLKIIVFGCSDAHGVVVYNGIGMDDAGLMPNDWLLVTCRKKLFDGGLENLLQGLKRDLEVRLQNFA